MKVLSIVIEFLATMLEGYIGIKFAGILLEPQYEFKKLNYMTFAVSISLAVIVSFLNSITLFSYITLAFGIISNSVVVRIFYKSQFPQAFMIMCLYFMCLNYLDFFAITIVGAILQDPEYSKIVVSTYGWLRLRQMMICKGLLIAVYLVAKKFIKEKFRNDSLQHYTFLTIAGSIGIIFLIENSIRGINSFTIAEWVIFSIILVLGWALVILYEKNKHEKDMAHFMEMRNALLEENYKSLSEAYSANAKVYHDFNNHINILYQYLIKGNSKKALAYLESMGEPIKNLLEKTWTGNEVIDVIINNKLRKMQDNNIRSKINIEFPNNSDIMSSDICTILGNLLDNAIEACQRNSHDANKWINITIRIINAMLIFKIENGNELMPISQKMRLITSKKDRRFHGWGLKSVETAVEKYEGIMQYTTEEKKFQVVVTLNYNIIDKTKDIF